MLDINRLKTTDNDFWTLLKDLLAWDNVSDDSVQSTVKKILTDVRREGDDAVVKYTNQLDRMEVKDISALSIPQERLQQALERLSDEQRQALELSAERVRKYHEKQKMQSWSYTEDDGTLLGQQVTPLDRVGLYVPGGQAAYPSSVLMNAIPARVAGVEELIMVVPTPDGQEKLKQKL